MTWNPSWANCTLPQAMVCCPTAPIHYLNQWWNITNDQSHLFAFSWRQFHSDRSVYHNSVFENYIFENTAITHKGQSVTGWSIWQSIGESFNTNIRLVSMKWSKHGCLEEISMAIIKHHINGTLHTGKKTMVALITRFMGPTWVLLAPGGPHVGHMNFAIWGIISLNTPKT